jgi:hypothetical protein
MLKFLFWTLLAANLGLLAYQLGYLNAWFPDGHEPARMAQQVHVEKMKLIPADALAAVSTSTPLTAPKLLACSEIGDFDAAAAKRFETQIAPLAKGNALSKHDVQDTARNMVYIPSQGSKEGADKKVNELRHLGVNDFYVIQDAGELHWAISLGVFKTEDAARAQLAALNQKGVHSARLGTRSPVAGKVAYQLHNLDENTKAGLDKIALDYQAIEVRDCTSDPVAVDKTAASSPNPRINLPREAYH